jgi:glycosyltransferase involved in cell wall biosynthesis
MNPKITLLTASRHRPDLLYKCIKAAQKSTLQEYEHIVIGDNCKWTRGVCDLFKDDPRIRYYETPSPYVWNSSSIGKNIGIKEASTDYFAYCDDDNVILPNHLQTIYDNLSTGTQICRTLMCEITLSYEDSKNALEQILKRDINETQSGKIHGKDMQTIGHNREIIESVGHWTPAHLIEKDESWGKSSTNEDDYILRKISKKYGNDIIKDTNIVTLIYYAHAGHLRGPDKYYDDLTEGQLFVYPNITLKHK